MVSCVILLYGDRKYQIQYENAYLVLKGGAEMILHRLGDGWVRVRVRVRVMEHSC